MLLLNTLANKVEPALILSAGLATTLPWDPVPALGSAETLNDKAVSLPVTAYAAVI